MCYYEVRYWKLEAGHWYEDITWKNSIPDCLSGTTYDWTAVFERYVFHVC